MGARSHRGVPPPGGDVERARGILAILQQQAHSTGSGWALAALDRCHGMVDGSAEHFDRAIESDHTARRRSRLHGRGSRTASTPPGPSTGGCTRAAAHRPQCVLPVGRARVGRPRCRGARRGGWRGEASARRPRADRTGAGDRPPRRGRGRHRARHRRAPVPQPEDRRVAPRRGLPARRARRTVVDWRRNWSASSATAARRPPDPRRRSAQPPFGSAAQRPPSAQWLNRAPLESRRRAERLARSFIVRPGMCSAQR